MNYTVNMNICIIDDEEAICTALADFVKRLDKNNSIYTLFDSTKAIDLIKDKNIDLILTDIRMPRTTGLDILNEVKSQNLPTKVVLMSGQSDIVDSINAIEIGALDFLTKPIDIKRIAEIIQSIQKKN